MVSRNRLKSSPLTVRRGLPKLVGLASAWISTSSGRVPSIVTATADPGTLTIRSARNASDGLATSIMPLCLHLEDADLGGRAEPVLHAAQQPVGVEGVALQVEHRVDDVLQHLGPGDGALLGDVADEEDWRALSLRPALDIAPRTRAPG